MGDTAAPLNEGGDVFVRQGEPPRVPEKPAEPLVRPAGSRVKSSFADDPDRLKRAVAKSVATRKAQKLRRDEEKAAELERVAQVERGRAAIGEIQRRLREGEKLTADLLREASLTDLFLIAVDPKTPPRERISAHNIVLDRVEGKPLQRVEQTGNVNLTFVPADWWRSPDGGVVDADPAGLPAA